MFLADGFDGASMNDIARVAGVSKGTLYVYFDSKEALFEALIREDRKQQAERCVIPVDAADPREPLAAFGRALMRVMTQPELIAQVRIVIARDGEVPEASAARSTSRDPATARRGWPSGSEAGAPAAGCDFDDGRRAARQFIDLCKSGVFSACLFGVTESATPEAIADTVDAAVEVFMRAYGVRRRLESPRSQASISPAERGRRVGRRVAPLHFAVASDQEFREIPLDRLRAEQPRRRMLQRREQRMAFGAVDVDLGEHREAHVIVVRAEASDLRFVARLLMRRTGRMGTRAPRSRAPRNADAAPQAPHIAA